MLAALAGLRVLDLSRVLAGPWAGQLLADLGADVVKVEQPGKGDDTRAWGPPWLDEEADQSQGRDSAYYLCANRNKRSIAIDLSSAEGQALVRRLAQKADIVIENFKVGALEKYGLDYSSLQALNPRLIYCSITGFGQTGPNTQRPGYDLLIQAMAGLMSITGRPDSETGGGPQKVGVALTDILSGLYSAVGILAALRHRDLTGEGQHIDLALFDVQVACLANQASNYLVGGTAPQRMGNAHPNIVPYQDFPTADGYMVLAIGNDQQFRRFCDAAGMSQWADDPRFGSNPQRVAHRAELIPAIAACTRTRSTQDWIASLEAVGVPCGPINDLAAVFAEPQVQARALRVDLSKPNGSKVPMVANPIKLSKTPVRYQHPPPQLDANRLDILRDWLGEE